MLQIVSIEKKLHDRIIDIYMVHLVLDKIFDQ